MAPRVPRGGAEEDHDLVDVHASVGEVHPVTDLTDLLTEGDLADARLLPGLAERGRTERLTGFDVALGERPSVLPAFMQEKDAAVRDGAEDGAARELWYGRFPGAERPAPGVHGAGKEPAP